jgi:hypothetical protein
MADIAKRRTRSRALAAIVPLSIILVGGFALARGGNEHFDTMPAYAPTDQAPETSGTQNDEAPRAKKTVARGGYGAPICVRLCDGYFFPSYSSAGGDAACAAQCPDAPVAMYSMNSDNIDDAVSLSGKTYAQLPAANRYSSQANSTCSCHLRGYGTSLSDILKDQTLRKGDFVMTANGFVEYIGGSSTSSFVAIDRATGLSAELRTSLRLAKAESEKD